MMNAVVVECIYARQTNVITLIISVCLIRLEHNSGSFIRRGDLCPLVGCRGSENIQKYNKTQIYRSSGPAGTIYQTVEEILIFELSDLQSRGHFAIRLRAMEPLAQL